jgi:DnaA regulatory inactivator Hda
MTEQLVFDLPQRVALGRDAFLVADSNAEAIALIDGAAKWTQPVQWIYGPAGSGKSHLVAVLANQLCALLLPAQRLAEDSQINNILAGDTAADMLVIDGLDHLPRHAEEVLFHLLNQARHGGVPMLLLSRAPATRLDIALPDLASRLKAIPAISLGAPCDALVAGLIGKLFADRQLRPEARVIDYLLPRIDRDYQAMGRLVAAIDAAALAEQRAVTVPLVTKVLDSHANLVDED